MTLAELRIANLGVIEELHLVLPAGSIAVTGETGAGKTMVVGAIQLLMGGRAEPEMVRVGAPEAIVEGRFVDLEGVEVVVRRVVPAEGRSRAYIDGSLATASALADRVGPIVDLHGQHAQQSLLRAETQRTALDRFGSIDRSPVRDARADVAAIDAALADLGGDETERARHIDLLRYQLDELDQAGLVDPDEDDELREIEDRLANVFDDQLAAAHAGDLLGSDGPIADALSQAAGIISDRSSVFDEVSSRLQLVQDELGALAADLRLIGEQAIDDPEQRDAVRDRRQLLVELRRKYGPTLLEVIDYHHATRRHLQDLESHEQQVAELAARRTRALERLHVESSRLKEHRRKAAEPLAKAVESELTMLAMPNARVTVTVDGESGDTVSILLAPNPGLPPLPVGKNASGGELSRTMLALRLVLAGGPPVKVFDEVDAGIGGEAARAVGAALATIGRQGQAFVVTHLPQVAACADHHIVIAKSNQRGSTSSQATLLSEEERVVEISRLLSGSPESDSAREHAEELLQLSSSSRTGR